jgi:hypothetical protein
MSYRPRSLRAPRRGAEQFRGSEESPPRGPGPLTAGFRAALLQTLEAAQDRGLDLTEVTARFADLDLTETIAEAADDVYAAMRKDLPSLHRHLQAGEERIAHYLDSIWSGPDRLYEAFGYAAFEMGSALAGAPTDRRQDVLLGLHSRACRVFSEIRCLVRNGFGAAAEARWRSLHELTVSATILAGSDHDVAIRYAARADVERWQDMKAFNIYAEQLGQEPFTDEEQDATRSAHDAAVKLHGPSIVRENGWAAPLFPGALTDRRYRIRFTQLEAKAELQHMRPFYRQGSHHVHAGPRGAELNVLNAPEGALTTPGATVYFDRAEISHAAMTSLWQETSALCDAHSADETEHEDVVDRWLENAIGLRALKRFLDDAAPLWMAAFRDAQSRGLILR